MICNKCAKEVQTIAGHLGKKHKKCGGRKRGESKKNCGVWVKESAADTKEAG